MMTPKAVLVFLGILQEMWALSATGSQSVLNMSSSVVLLKARVSSELNFSPLMNTRCDDDGFKVFVLEGS